MKRRRVTYDVAVMRHNPVVGCEKTGNGDRDLGVMRGMNAMDARDRMESRPTSQVAPDRRDIPRLSPKTLSPKAGCFACQLVIDLCPTIGLRGFHHTSPIHHRSETTGPLSSLVQRYPSPCMLSRRRGTKHDNNQPKHISPVPSPSGAISFRPRSILTSPHPG